MIDPMLVILAPPAAVFGWVLFELRRGTEERTDEAPATVTVKAEPAAPAWQPSVGASA